VVLATVAWKGVAEVFADVPDFGSDLFQRVDNIGLFLLVCAREAGSVASAGLDSGADCLLDDAESFEDLRRFLWGWRAGFVDD